MHRVVPTPECRLPIALETTMPSRRQTHTSSRGMFNLDHIGSKNLSLHVQEACDPRMLIRTGLSIIPKISQYLRAVRLAPSGFILRTLGGHALTPANTLVISSTLMPARGRFETLALAASVAICRATLVWGQKRFNDGKEVRRAPLEVLAIVCSIIEARQRIVHKMVSR